MCLVGKLLSLYIVDPPVLMREQEPSDCESSEQEANEESVSNIYRENLFNLWDVKRFLHPETNADPELPYWYLVWTPFERLIGKKDLMKTARNFLAKTRANWSVITLEYKEDKNAHKFHIHYNMVVNGSYDYYEGHQTADHVKQSYGHFHVKRMENMKSWKDCIFYSLKENKTRPFRYGTDYWYPKIQGNEG